MTSKHTPLLLPKEAEILLSALKLTDGKVDQLLPLLALLQEETGERSELGEALLNALRLIHQELHAFQLLRQDLETQMTSLTHSLSALEKQNKDIARRTDAMHDILMEPLTD